MAWRVGETPVARRTRVVSHEWFLKRIRRFQKRRPDTDATRAFNHEMVEALHQMRPLVGRSLLDVGGSYCGYSIEHALDLGASLAVAVSLEIFKPTEVQAPSGVGRLLPMNAESLDFPGESFDLLLSLSLFEHLRDVRRVLDEMHRVLKPGGSALVSFEPVWTCSYGHHLHHLADVARLIPPWAHLLWDPVRMRAELTPRWPAEAPLTVDQAVRWIYEDRRINRRPASELKAEIEASQLTVEWILPLPDEATEEKRRAAEAASRRLPYSVDELMIRGWSALLNKS